MLRLCYRNSKGKTKGRGRRCEDQGLALQPRAPPACLQLLGCAYRRIWFSLQGSSEDRNLVSFRGNLTKSSTPNVLSWGHRSPNPQTGCPAIRPLTRTCCVITHGKLWCPLRSWSPRSFFYNLFSNSQPCFLPQWYLQSPEVDMPPGAPGRDNLAHQSVYYRSISFWSSRTSPRPHQEAAKLMAAPGTRGPVRKITAQN